MKRPTPTTRRTLSASPATWIAAACAVAALAGGIAPGAGAADPPLPRSTAVLAPAGEPGTRLVVTGRLFASDGKQALPGVRVELWQTDAKGLYAEDGSMSLPRLRGELVTGPRGEYEIRTIRPAPYPNRPIPAHIHYRVLAKGGAEMFELRFDDDKLVTQAERERSRRDGTFGEVQPVRADRDGSLHVTKDVRLPRGE